MGIMGKIRRMFGCPNITTIVDDDGTTIIRDMGNSVDIVLHWDDAHKLIASEVYDEAK